MLCRVAHDNHARSEPALTALVVHKADGIVGVRVRRGPHPRRRRTDRGPGRAREARPEARLECYRWAGATMPASGGRAAVSPRFEQIQARLRKERRAAEQPTICTSCYMAIPPTGVCDNCG